MERKGICQNVGVCSMANKVQVITDDDADFKCVECGEELKPYVEEKVDPTKKGKGKLIAGIAAAVVLLGAGAYFGLSGGSEKPADGPTGIDTTKIDTVKVDTTKQAETTAAPEKPATPPVAEPAKGGNKNPGGDGGGTVDGQGTKKFPYGKYVGYLKGGQPDGSGQLTFTASYQLNDEYTAEAGDYIQGVFQNGKPTFVTLYKKDGTVVKIKLR